jgi:hypothetical protein
MGTVLLIGVTGALGCLALGLGVFVLDKPPPTHPSAQRVRMSCNLILIRLLQLFNFWLLPRNEP